MGEKETSVRLGSVLVETPAGSYGIIPGMFSPRLHSWIEAWPLLHGRLIKSLKAMVAYLKVSTNEKTYSNYLWAAREAEKEEAMEPSHSQTTDNTSKSKVTSFFPLQKLKGTQPTETPAVRVAHLEEEGSDEEVGAENEDPDRNQWCDRGVYSVPS